MKFKAFISKTTAQAKSGMSKVSNTVKLYSTRTRISEELSQMYDTLGKMSYSQAMGEGIPREDITKVIDEITRLKAELVSIEETIRELNGRKLCPSCNMELQSNLMFCPYCGAKVGTEETEDGSDNATSEREV